MRAILIDAKNHEIREIEVKGYESIQEAVGGFLTTGFYLPKRHVCYVDDEGLLKEPQDFFICDFVKGSTTSGNPYAGNGVIVGTSPQGNDIKCKLELDFIRSHVHFLDIRDVQAGIRMGHVNYDVKFITETGSETIATIDLGAFNNERKGV